MSSTRTSLEQQLYTLQWGAYEAWSAYGAEVPLAVPSEAASQVSLASLHFHTCQPPVSLPHMYQYGLEMRALHTYTLTLQYHTAVLSPAHYVALLQVTQCYVPYLSGLQLFEHSPTVRSVTPGSSSSSVPPDVLIQLDCWHTFSKSHAVIVS